MYYTYTDAFCVCVCSVACLCEYTYTIGEGRYIIPTQQSCCRAGEVDWVSTRTLKMATHLFIKCNRCPALSHLHFLSFSLSLSLPKFLSISFLLSLSRALSLSRTRASFLSRAHALSLSDSLALSTSRSLSFTLYRFLCPSLYLFLSHTHTHSLSPFLQICLAPSCFRPT